MTDRQSTHASDCWSWGPRHYECAVREIAAQVAEVKRVTCELMDATTRAERLAEALRWYAEQAQLCRKFGSEGDAARHALSADGGKRANRALAQEDRNG